MCDGDADSDSLSGLCRAVVSSRLGLTIQAVLVSISLRHKLGRKQAVPTAARRPRPLDFLCSCASRRKSLLSPKFVIIVKTRVSRSLCSLRARASCHRGKVSANVDQGDKFLPAWIKPRRGKVSASVDQTTKVLGTHQAVNFQIIYYVDRWVVSEEQQQIQSRAAIAPCDPKSARRCLT